MTCSRDTARNEMMSMLNSAWQTNAAAVAGSVPPIIWQDVPGSVPGASFYWLRVQMTTQVEKQSSLSPCVGNIGEKRYTASGILVLELFCPKTIPNANQIGGLLAETARDAFRGKQSPSGVWFRNATIKDISPQDAYWRFNVVINFVYDDLG